jgi:hypothetical protein
MWTVLVTIVFAVAFIGLAVFLVIHSHKKEKERTRAMQQIAARLGWSFAETAPLNMITGLERFVLFSEGHSKQIRNFMYGEAQAVKAAAFDYRYTVGSGKHSHTYFQSVVYLEPQRLNVPFFSLRPESFLHKMMSAFGYQDIDFGQRPDFSSQVVLRGQDEPAIRQVFNDRLLSFYENYAGLCTDGGGNQVFIFRIGHRYEAHEIEGFVGLGLQLVGLLRGY